MFEDDEDDSVWKGWALILFLLAALLGLAIWGVGQKIRHPPKAWKCAWKEWMRGWLSG